LSLKCPFCGEVFTSWEMMNEHIRVKHKDRVRLAKFEHPKRKNRA